MSRAYSIGVFDSGYGGLTVFQAIRQLMPQYHYVYLGDNSRAPYGSKSFSTVYRYTWECVSWLIEQQKCRLVIVACNTASARALRTIQQTNLSKYPGVRVLGVIRPTAEIIGNLSKTRKIGIVGTEGTINSKTYLIEIEHFAPDLEVVQQACPLWVPLIEANRTQSQELRQIIKQDIEALLQQQPNIDTLLLGCTHYPLVESIIREFLPPQVQIISQGPIVAHSLKDYLNRHPELESTLILNPTTQFFTTDDAETFSRQATQFYNEQIIATQINL